MASRVTLPPAIEYPDSDGRPMAETPHHRQVMTDTIEALERWYADDSHVCVSGNMLMYYERGNPRRHVSPDVFVTKDIDKNPTPARRLYLVWEEGKGPDVVMEITSKSTRREDLKTKFALYQDILRVTEYFLYDPYGEYLRPRLQGYRLHRCRYVPIKPVKGRLPSKILGLHLEAVNGQLRFYDPTTEAWLPTPAERIETAESERARAELERVQAEAERWREAAARQQAEAELARLRLELETLRRRSPEA
jgi:Uma2 family endonuclease